MQMKMLYHAIVGWMACRHGTCTA